MKKFFTTLCVTTLFMGLAFAQQPFSKESGKVSKVSTERDEMRNTTGKETGKEFARRKLSLQTEKTTKHRMQVSDSRQATKDRVKSKQKTSTKQNWNPKAMTLRTKSIIKSTKADVATIKLVVDDPWGDGTGFQMLIDADHDMYDYLGGGLYELAPEEYDEFEYKIPENADGDLNTQNIILKATGSVEVPGGMYDFFITNPTPADETIYYAGGEYSVQDDFVFEAGYEYIFEVSNDRAIVNFIPEIDAGILELILPDPSENLTAQENIRISVMNNGSKDISGITLVYQINDETPVKEAYNQTITAGNSAYYTFTTKADFSAKKLYKVKVGLELNGDAIAKNNEMTGYTKNITVHTLPFYEDFTEETSILERWSVLDGDEDEIVWEYDDSERDADGGYGCAMFSYGLDGADDYLITDPIRLEAGSHHIVFYAFPDGNSESMKVLYGTSSDPGQMAQLADYPILFRIEKNWEPYVIQFTVPTAGDYYFAFNAYGLDGLYLNLDNITIGKGVYTGTPDIRVHTPLLPVSGCEISSESVIGAEIYNVGTEPINGFQLTYDVKDKTPVTETFNDVIGLRESKTFYFDTKVDLSELGTYNVELRATCDGEVNIDNNEIEYSVTNFAPVGIPFTSEFYDPDDNGVADWNEAKYNTWKADLESGYGYYPLQGDAPLVSRCVTLPVGKYTFSFDYLAGYNFFGIFILYDNFYFTYGKSGTDPSSWEPVKEFKDMYVEDLATEEIVIDITEAGEYVFAFVAEGIPYGFSLYSTDIRDMPDHDVRLDNFGTAIPRMLPRFHAEGEHTFDLTLANRGKNEEEVKMEIKMGDNVIAASDIINLPFNEIKNVPLTGNITLPATQNEIELIASAIIQGNEDANPNDNTLKITRQVSDTIFAWDNIDANFPDGVGFNGQTGSLGTSYNLNKANNLTSVNIGLFEKDYTGNFGFSVYKINDDLTVGDAIIYEEFERGSGGESQNFVLPETKLEAGNYFFEVVQIETDNVAVAFDEDENGYFEYIATGDVLEQQGGFGYLHIRPNFGKPGVGIDDVFVASKIRLFPNPVKDVMNITSPENISQIVIYNTLGKKVYSSAIGLGTGSYQINTDKLPQGMYFAQIRTINGETVIKFIIK